MTRNIALTGLCLMALCSLAACGRQSTPSMVNTTRPQLAPETMMQQVEVSQISEGYLDSVAERYKRYGTSAMQLTVGYDESSKSYTAMNAFKDLDKIKSSLALKGVKNVQAKTATIQKGEKPVLWVNFDAATAVAPEGCTTMPGIDNQTTPHINQYKFGCSIDSVMVKQLYRPADLAGVGNMESGSGRKAQTQLESYHVVTDSEANVELEEYGRGQIASE